MKIGVFHFKQGQIMVRPLPVQIDNIVGWGNDEKSALEDLAKRYERMAEKIRNNDFQKESHEEYGDSEWGQKEK